MAFTRAIVHMGVVLALSGPIPDGQLNALRLETSEIWRPYGVELTWLDVEADCSWSGTVDRTLRVVADSQETRSKFPASLGSVRFENGRPGDTIRLRYAPLSRFVMDATFSTWAVRALPPHLRDQIVGRALGRVLAHELGHVLIGSAHDGGLMRETFSPSMLVAQGRDDLRLSKASVRQLDERRNATP